MCDEQAQVADEVIAASATMKYQKVKHIVEEALCDGGEEQYSLHVTHPQHAEDVLAVLAKHGLVRTTAGWPSYARAAGVDEDLSKDYL